MTLEELYTSRQELKQIKQDMHELRQHVKYLAAELAAVKTQLTMEYEQEYWNWVTGMDSFISHPKNNSWKNEKELRQQIDEKIKSGKLIPGTGAGQLTVRKMTDEEKKKYQVLWFCDRISAVLICFERTLQAQKDKIRKYKH